MKIKHFHSLLLIILTSIILQLCNFSCFVVTNHLDHPFSNRTRNKKFKKAEEPYLVEAKGDVSLILTKSLFIILHRSNDPN